MPQVVNPGMQHLGNGDVWMTPSKSTPGKTYVTIRTGEGKVSCTCPGWTYRYRCWHTDAVKPPEDDKLDAVVSIE